jgi:uncharacterized membrane protein
MRKKIIALFLGLALVFSLLPNQEADAASLGSFDLGSMESWTSSSFTGTGSKMTYTITTSSGVNYRILTYSGGTWKESSVLHLLKGGTYTDSISTTKGTKYKIKITSPIFNKAKGSVSVN